MFQMNYFFQYFRFLSHKVLPKFILLNSIFVQFNTSPNIPNHAAI